MDDKLGGVGSVEMRLFDGYYISPRDLLCLVTVETSEEKESGVDLLWGGHLEGVAG